MNEEVDTRLPHIDWVSGWRLRASAWTGTDIGADATVFRSLASPGDLSPDLHQAPWSFHLGLSETIGGPRCVLLSNGFRLEFPEIVNQPRITCMVPKHGQLVGAANIVLRPTLFSPQQAVTEGDGTFATQHGNSMAFLLVKASESMTRFALIVTESSEADARKLAEEALNLDQTVLFNEEQARRQALYNENGTCTEPTLVAHALETLIFHLEAPRGSMRQRWSSARPPALPGMDFNQLVPLVLCWNELDAGVSRELVQCAIDAIGNDGTFSSSAGPEGPEGGYSWPCLARIAQVVYDNNPDEEWLAELVPALRRYLLWAVDFFDPQQLGLTCWPEPERSFIPDTYDENLASAALTSFLLADLDALFYLLGRLGQVALDTIKLDQTRELFRERMDNALWDMEDLVYRDRYVGGEQISRITLSGIMPLYRADLEEDRKDALLRLVRDPSVFNGNHGAPLWQAWDQDEVSPPVPAVHQIYLLESLRRQGAEQAAIQIEERLDETFRHTFSQQGKLPADLHAADGEVEGVPPWFDAPVLPACLLLQISPRFFRRGEDEIAPWMLSLDRYRTATLTTLVAALLILAGLVSWFLGQIDQRTQISGENTRHEVIQRLIVQQKYDEALQLIEEAPTSGDELAYGAIRANLLYRKRNYKGAAEIYRKLAAADIDEEQATLNLGLSLFRDGRFEEAETTYSQYLETYSDGNEKLRGIATLAREFIQKNRTTLVPEIIAANDQMLEIR